MTQGFNDVVYLTEEGLQKIKDELAYLKGEKREEMANKLQIAIAQGDLKENADYHAAKEEQGFVDGRIKDLEDSLRRAKIIQDVGPADKVRVGHTVTVLELDEGESYEATYYIVGAHEADPANGRISNESPIGRALLGSKKGQTVAVQTPGGQIQLQIQSIS
ncbi:MAG: transcription elongation factor GreA [Ardenticatenaceae bacterium]|nr:MAG: transcription elongation factor GreA [Ardenticatenaceae bacterium]